MLPFCLFQYTTTFLYSSFTCNIAFSFTFSIFIKSPLNQLYHSSYLTKIVILYTIKYVVTNNKRELQLALLISKDLFLQQIWLYFYLKEELPVHLFLKINLQYPFSLFYIRILFQHFFL